MAELWDCERQDWAERNMVKLPGGNKGSQMCLALQHYPDERHGGPERHSRDSRESWGSYGSDRRMSESRGIPPPSRSVL